MSLTLPQTCNMGSSQTGLTGTIGVTLLNPDGTTKTARATAGIYEIGGGTYGKQITFDDNWSGVIAWDTGGSSPVYAVVEYNVEGLVDTVIEDTAEIGTAGAGLTNISLPNQTMDIVGDITGNLSGSVGSLTGHTNQTADHTAKISNIETDTNELQTDWTDGGRLDLLIDAIPTTAMRGTDSAALASVCSETRLAELDAANLPSDINGVKTTVDAAESTLALIKAKTDNQPAGIPKNVALNNFKFLMVLLSDQAPAPGLTITGAISKDSGTFASCVNTITEIGYGVYSINLTQEEMNAEMITLKFTENTCCQRIITIKTSI